MIPFLMTVVRRLSGLTYALGAVAIGLMMLQVATHVFFQYVLSYPLPGTMLFVSNYYMVVVTFLCLAAVEMKDGHIAVDLVTSRLSPRVQRVLAGISYLITATIFSLLTWQSLYVAEARRAAGTFEIEYGIKIAIWPSYYIVPIGASLFAFAAVVKLLALVLREPIKPESNHSEVIRSME